MTNTRNAYFESTTEAYAMMYLASFVEYCCKRQIRRVRMGRA